jgi:hypothetical protein
MHWYIYVAHFFGAMFLANAIPHFVAGLSGRAFQSPFAKLRGVGLSSAVVNVLWGWGNLVAAYVLLVTIGYLSLGDVLDASVFAVGLLVMGLMLAMSFGTANGGKLGR